MLQKLMLGAASGNIAHVENMEGFHISMKKHRFLSNSTLYKESAEPTKQCLEPSSMQDPSSASGGGQSFNQDCSKLGLPICVG